MVDPTIRRVAAAALWLACLTTGSASGAPVTSLDDPYRIYYFGNSLTESSRPAWHKELFIPAGKHIENFAFLGAGWQTWQHRNEVFNAMGKPLSETAERAGSQGDLTIGKEAIVKASRAPKVFLEQDWDAILIQVFGTHVNKMASEMYGKTQFGQEIEVGDAGAAIDLINVFLAKNPQGTIYIYTVWPSMPAGQIPPSKELPEWAKQEGARIKEAEFPNRDEFDYAAQWDKPYDGEFEKPWIGFIHRTRDYTNKVFEAVKEAFPELWVQGRLRMIPGGELFYDLDKKAQAGLIPGISSIEDFYTDVQHIRAGLANYTIAALYYAAFFREKPPLNLDYTKYNTQEEYGQDLNHDFGGVIEITPERAEAIHKTIWDVLQNHPYAGFRK